MQLIVYTLLIIYIATYMVIVSCSKINVEGGINVYYFARDSLLCFVSYLLFAFAPSELSETIKTALLILAIAFGAIFLFTCLLVFAYRPRWIIRRKPWVLGRFIYRRANIFTYRFWSLIPSL